jgi:hypothetical protein
MPFASPPERRASRVPPQLSKARGGRRPGAGAPRGNLNGLKSGKYSRQVRAFRLALQAVPRTAETIRRLDAIGDNRRALLAVALHHYADLLLLGALSLPKGQSTDPSKIDTLQLRKIIAAADPNHAIKAHTPEAIELRTSSLELHSAKLVFPSIAPYHVTIPRQGALS